jgi:hypothetical protein
MDPKSWDRGKIVAVAIVKKVGPTRKIFKKSEYRFWNVDRDYNSAAEWAVRFEKVIRLKHPVEARGCQAPFTRASYELVAKVLIDNPEVEQVLYPGPGNGSTVSGTLRACRTLVENLTPKGFTRIPAQPKRA